MVKCSGQKNKSSARNDKERNREQNRKHFFSLYEPHVPAPWVFWDVTQELEWVQRRTAGMVKVWTSSVRSKCLHEKETAEKGIEWTPLQPLATQRTKGDQLCFTVQETAVLLSNKASRQKMQKKQQEVIFHTMSKEAIKPQEVVLFNAEVYMYSISGWANTRRNIHR